METPSAYSKQLKTKIDTNLTHQNRYKSDPSGNLINLSDQSFSSDSFKLLNKNLYFIPTARKYIKKKLDSDAANFLLPHQTSSLLQGYQTKVEHRSGKPTCTNKRQKKKKNGHLRITTTFIDLV